MVLATSGRSLSFGELEAQANRSSLPVDIRRRYDVSSLEAVTHTTNFAYHGDPQKTADGRDVAGTRSTVGDVGHLDEDGYLYLADCKSDMVVSGGVNIYPQEVENLLVTHPKVLDAAVFGVPNTDFGEEVKAVVQVVAGAVVGPELAQELIELCRDNLAHCKCARSVDFEHELPRLPTGKLYKRLLRDRYWNEATSQIV